MKSQKGLIVPLPLIVLLLVVLAAGNIYFFSDKNSAIVPIDQGNTATTSIAMGTVTVTVSTSTITTTSGDTTHSVVAGEGEHCGGNMTTAPVCAESYQCTPTLGSHLPFGDVGGTCEKKQTGTLSGSVRLSPTCPVEKNPPDPQCAPKPYQAEIKVMNVEGNSIVASMQGMADGSFTFTLPAGRYQIVAGEGNPYPRCSSVTVMLEAGSTTVANVSCDTGIR